MNTGSEEDSLIYKVVVNDEAQYSIWPIRQANPIGWRDTDKIGSKAQCLAHINQIWTDMRPLKVRKQLACRKGV